MADFTKSGAQVDEWAQIAADATRTGADISHADDVGILLEITVAHDSTNAHANGAKVIVEVSSNSSGDEDWTEHVEFRSSGGTAVQANVDQTSSSNTLYVDATTGFETEFTRFFVKDATIANSEVGRTVHHSVDEHIECMDSLTNSHANTADVFNIVDQWMVRVPAAFNRSRVIIFNDDADCTICSRTRKALATDIE